MAKVYVSSTIADLELERRAVMEWLRKARHQAVDSYLPDSRTVRDSCLADIDMCDIYVLILGHRYGFQPKDKNPENLSITHLEFRRASRSSIPCVALLRNNVPNIRLSDLEDPQRAPLVLAFRSEVQREVRPSEFSDPGGLIEGLSTGVQAELSKLLGPSQQSEKAWLTAHLESVARQFASHINISAIKSGTSPEELYLDLEVTERKLGEKSEHYSESEQIIKESQSLEVLVKRMDAPFLLIGEGGSGKTTSLLYTAARAADRAKVDETAPIPIYVNLAGLTKLDDIPDLYQLIADSVPIVADWNELSDLGIFESRKIQFLFDSFNEMPEDLHRNGVVILKRFIKKQKDRHMCLIGSRLDTHLEQLARDPSQFRTFEILRLASEQVQSFLKGLGLGSLYERMPIELRELARNPFMLLAIARTLAGVAEKTLPRNRGRLYQRFVLRWMEKEKKRRVLSCSYERVKEPLLSYLANRMTSAGETSLSLSNALEEEIKLQLENIYERVKRLGGMPEDWTVDKCLAEILDDGLMKRVNNQLHFMHQSVQEYFTGYFFSDDSSAPSLVDFTPKLLAELLPVDQLVEVPNHRFVSPLLMMVGVLDDSTRIVESLAERNPILAAAAISSASKVKHSALQKLERTWLDLLDHDDQIHRIIGCSCIVLADMKSNRSIQRLVSFSIETDFHNSSVGIPALERLGVPERITVELVSQIRSMSEDKYKTQGREIKRVVRELQSKDMVKTLFEQWSQSPLDSSIRQRLEDVLATVDVQRLNEELERIKTLVSDEKVVKAFERLITDKTSQRGGFARALSQFVELQIKRYEDQVVETLTKLRKEKNELMPSLRSTEPTVRAAAAIFAAERRVPVGDTVLESLLRSDQTWIRSELMEDTISYPIDQSRSQHELIAALVSLLGEDTAASRLVAESTQSHYCVGNLGLELASQIELGKISDDVTAEIEGLGVREYLTIVSKEVDGDTTVWLLQASSRTYIRPLFQLRVSPKGIAFHDCNVAVRAFHALTKIPGECSLVELRKAIDHDDSRVQAIAIEALAHRKDQDLIASLLERLRSATSVDFVDAALNALGVLRASDAVSLVNDLLVITEGEFSDIHPIWGPRSHHREWGGGPRSQYRGWCDGIHRTLVRINADSEIQEALDKALDSDDAEPKVAALREFSRWFTETDLTPEREAKWRRTDRLKRLLDLALHDSKQSVRGAAAEALGKLTSNFIESSLAIALADDAVEVQVAACDALVRIQVQELYRRAAKAMLKVVKADHAQDLRRRAGAVLSAIPGGVDPLYQPIKEKMKRGDSERALEAIEATLEIIPEDVNLLWWRGHMLRDLGQLDRAADNFQCAFELEKRASVIPQALSHTLLELGDFSRAIESAQLGVEINPFDADAQSILAWSSYKAGAFPEAFKAAKRAVDLDPVHGVAIWIVLLGQIRQANPEGLRSAFQHAFLVCELLSPGLDTSFIANFMKEIRGIKTADTELSRLIGEIRDTLSSKDEVVHN